MFAAFNIVAASAIAAIPAIESWTCPVVLKKFMEIEGSAQSLTSQQLANHIVSQCGGNSFNTTQSIIAIAVCAASVFAMYKIASKR